MPPYRVSIKHAGGKWVSDINYLQSARDTERLGRYEDESQWVWENISLDVPHDVKDIVQIGIRFVTKLANSIAFERNINAIIIAIRPIAILRLSTKDLTK